MSSFGAAMEEGTLPRFQEKTSNLYDPRELYKVAQYMDRDPDLWVFRRFGSLQILNILSIQQHLTVLEREFQRRMSAKPQLSCNDLMPDIQHTLSEYNNALSAQAKFSSYLKPEAHVLEHMKKWSSSHEPALQKGLDLHGKDQGNKDIVAIAATEKTWVHRFIDRYGPLRSLFEEKPTPGDQLWSTLTYSEESVRRAEAVFIHVGFCVLLLCPIVVLLYVDSKTWKLVVLVVSLLVVSVLSVAFLNTPNKTGLALVAGYGAILVVFLSNNTGS